MPTTRRRIFRRAVMALTIVVLLPVWYVASWISISCAAGHGLISQRTAEGIRPAFLPLIYYCRERLPGAEGLRRLWWTFNPRVKYEYPHHSSPTMFTNAHQLMPLGSLPPEFFENVHHIKIPPPYKIPPP